MQKMLYTIEELAEATGITPRTIRYYTTEGLTPTPETRGRYALYADAHLQRLQLVVKLKAAYLPLNTIKEKMAHLSTANVTHLLQGEPVEPDTDDPQAAEGQENAAEYLARVLTNRKTLASRNPVGRAPSSYPGMSRKSDAGADAAKDAPGEAWRHIELYSGIELIVRVPVSEKHRASMEKIVAYAQAVREGKE